MAGRMDQISGTLEPAPKTMVRRLRPPPSTAALPCTTGTTASTSGICCSARASARLSGRTLEIMAPDMPMVLVLPGATAIRLVPNCVNSASTKRWMPSPMAVSNTTAATPMAMPVTVSRLRPCWARTAATV